jgi:hypothetical protein
MSAPESNCVLDYRRLCSQAVYSSSLRMSGSPTDSSGSGNLVDSSSTSTNTSGSSSDETKDRRRRRRTTVGGVDSTHTMTSGLLQWTLRMTRNFFNFEVWILFCNFCIMLYFELWARLKEVLRNRVYFNY